jgi:hypothetical protein
MVYSTADQGELRLMRSDNPGDDWAGVDSNFDFQWFVSSWGLDFDHCDCSEDVKRELDGAAGVVHFEVYLMIVLIVNQATACHIRLPDGFDLYHTILLTELIKLTEQLVKEICQLLRTICHGHVIKVRNVTKYDCYRLLVIRDILHLVEIHRILHPVLDELREN